MKILAVGDVVGLPGVDLLSKRLPGLRAKLGADFVIVNGENACVRGISPHDAMDIFAAGADVITLGNHTFDNRKICDFLDENRNIIRPANMPPQRPGNGYTVAECMGKRVCVINLIGRGGMDFHNTSPFATVRQLLDEIEADIFAVDFHAELTSEKQAMAYYLEERVSVLFGTHTHVQTADARVFPSGMGYITDLGMTGGLDSVIGIKPGQSLSQFLGYLAPRFEASDSDLRIQGALFRLGHDGKCLEVTRIDTREMSNQGES